MRIGIVGAGGIGGYLAAQFARHETDVALIARGAHGAAIAERGLRMLSPDGETVARPALVSDDPARAGTCDLLILAVKAHQLADAIETARPMLGPGAHALTFQNGVEAPEMVARAYGADRALIGVARIFVNITGDGEITLRPDARSFTIGDLDGNQDSAGATGAIAAFRDAGIESPDCADVRADLWTKFLLFNAVSGTTAGARTTMGTVRRTPALWRLFEDLVRETEALARARGVALPAGVVEQMLAAAQRLPDDARASTAHDIEAGKPLEIDWTCGAAARLGDELGIAMPASRTVAALLAPYKDGR